MIRGRHSLRRVWQSKKGPWTVHIANGIRHNKFYHLIRTLPVAYIIWDIHKREAYLRKYNDMYINIYIYDRSINQMSFILTFCIIITWMNLRITTLSIPPFFANAFSHFFVTNSVYASRFTMIIARSMAATSIVTSSLIFFLFPYLTYNVFTIFSQ